MTNNDNDLLIEFEKRMLQLMQYCDSLKVENGKLKREIFQREGDIKSLILDNEQLKKKYDNLKFAKHISGKDGNDSESAELTQRRLSKLVQEVDKCIAMLKQ